MGRGTNWVESPLCSQSDSCNIVLSSLNQMILRQFTCRAASTSQLYAWMKRQRHFKEMAQPSSGNLYFSPFLLLLHLLAEQLLSTNPWTSIILILCYAFVLRSSSIQEDLLPSQQYRHHHRSRSECREWSPHLQRGGRLLEEMASTGTPLYNYVIYIMQ